MENKKKSLPQKSLSGKFISLDEAGTLIKNGGVIIFPTETFFAVGSMALNTTATKKIFAIKERTPEKALPLTAANEEQISTICHLPQELAYLLRPLWPGPLSVLLSVKDDIPEIITGRTKKVAIRISSHPAANKLALNVGGPISASSANISGESPVKNVTMLNEKLISAVDGILDILPAPKGGFASTIIEPLKDPRHIRILRHGAVSKNTLIQAGFIITPSKA